MGKQGACLSAPGEVSLTFNPLSCCFSAVRSQILGKRVDQLGFYILLFWGSKESTCNVGGGGLIAKSCPTLATPRTVACQTPLSMGFSRQEYWSGLLFPSPGMFLAQELNPGLLNCRQIPYQLSYKGSPQCGRLWFNPWVGKITWRRKQLSTPGFLPGELHGQWSLVVYRQWGCKELDTTNWLSLHFTLLR